MSMRHKLRIPLIARCLPEDYPGTSVNAPEEAKPLLHIVAYGAQILYMIPSDWREGVAAVSPSP